jgi:glutamate-1-semialdehyde aminotransferase
MNVRKNMGKSQNYYSKAKRIIPGGTQLLSKRPEMFLPNLWPSYYKKSKGCEVWDLDDKHYYDMGIMGIGTCVLGYANDDINVAVKQGSEVFKIIASNKDNLEKLLDSEVSHSGFERLN